jgi:NAD+ synthase
MQHPQPFHKDILKIDTRAVAERFTAQLEQDVFESLHRRGGVVGISGGVDSSVVLALSAAALGANRVLGVILPENDSNPESRQLAQNLGRHLGVKTIVEDITPILGSSGCYRRRDQAVAQLFPDFDSSTHKIKIGLPQNILDRDLINVFSITIVGPDGIQQTKRLPPREYLEIVAASNLKQRTRMSMLYYYAELHNYAVIGTGNKHEYQQGFFVKYGDGAADVMPIIQLYKTQVYQLAQHLNIPAEIIQRPSTSDTYSAASTQQEFFFQLPFDLMDLLWYGYENQYPAAEVAAALDMTEAQVKRAYQNFQQKQRTTEYLRLPPFGDYSTAF